MDKTAWKLRVVWLTMLLVPLVVAFAVDAKQVKLQVAIGSPEKTPIEALTEMVATFEKQYPDIDVEILNDYGNSFDKLATHMVGGVAPDIMHFYNETPILAMENGFLLNLRPYIDRDGKDFISDLLPLSIKQMSQGNATYGLPFQTSATGAVYYNRTMLDDAGIAYPTGEWNWKTFLETARKLTKEQDGKFTQVGYSQHPGWLWWFPWLVQAGVDFSNPLEVPLDSDAAITAIEFLRDGVDRMAFGWGATRGGFPTQTAAMTFSGSWELTVWANNKIPMGVTQAPSGPAGKATLTNTNVIAINANTKNPDEAWLFIKWLYNRQTQLDYTRRFGMQPSRLSLGYEWLAIVRERIRQSGNPEVAGLEAFIGSSAYAMPQPFFKKSAVISRYIQPAVTSIMTENKPVRGTLETMVQAAEAFLRE